VYLIDSAINQHYGRFVNSAGDSVLAEFASVVEAVNCAVEIQTGLKAENANLPPDRRMEFRIGVNLGDVMVEGDQIYGDGVNVAARLESLAEPGGICISRTVHENIRNKLPINFEDLGEQAVKNIAEPVRVYRVLLNRAVGAPQRTQRIPRKYWRNGVLSVAGLAIVIATIILVQHVSLKPQTTHASIPPQEKPALPCRLCSRGIPGGRGLVTMLQASPKSCRPPVYKTVPRVRVSLAPAASRHCSLLSRELRETAAFGRNIRIEVYRRDALPGPKRDRSLCPYDNRSVITLTAELLPLSLRSRCLYTPKCLAISLA